MYRIHLQILTWLQQIKHLWINRPGFFFLCISELQTMKPDTYLSNVLLKVHNKSWTFMHGFLKMLVVVRSIRDKNTPYTAHLADGSIIPLYEVHVSMFKKISGNDHSALCFRLICASQSPHPDCHMQGEKSVLKIAVSSL